MLFPILFLVKGMADEKDRGGYDVEATYPWVRDGSRFCMQNTEVEMEKHINPDISKMEVWMETFEYVYIGTSSNGKLVAHDMKSGMEIPGGYKKHAYGDVKEYGKYWLNDPNDEGSEMYTKDIDDFFTVWVKDTRMIFIELLIFIAYETRMDNCCPCEHIYIKN